MYDLLVNTMPYIKRQTNFGNISCHKSNLVVESSDDPFGKCAAFSKKLIFIITKKVCFFSQIFTYILNGWRNIIICIACLQLHLLGQLSGDIFLCYQEKKRFKGTLMQIWKSPYIFVSTQKQYPENFAFFTLRIYELFPREVCKFLKK